MNKIVINRALQVHVHVSSLVNDVQNFGAIHGDILVTYMYIIHTDYCIRVYNIMIAILYSCGIKGQMNESLDKHAQTMYSPCMHTPYIVVALST